MEYKYETHCHSSRCSRCAHATPTQLVNAYYEAGFSGLVLTDHFIHGNHCVDTSLSWVEQMRCYFDAYLEARQAAKKLDFQVFLSAYITEKRLCRHRLQSVFLHQVKL